MGIGVGWPPVLYIDTPGRLGHGYKGLQVHSTGQGAWKERRLDVILRVVLRIRYLVNGLCLSWRFKCVTTAIAIVTFQAASPVPPFEASHL